MEAVETGFPEVVPEADARRLRQGTGTRIEAPSDTGKVHIDGALFTQVDPSLVHTGGTLFVDLVHIGGALFTQVDPNLFHTGRTLSHWNPVYIVKPCSHWWSSVSH